MKMKLLSAILLAFVTMTMQAKTFKQGYGLET